MARTGRWRQVKMRIELTNSDMKLVSRDFESVLRWSVFSDAKGFSDGMLLYQAPRDYTWLPDSSLTDGTRLDARAIVWDARPGFGV